MHLLPKTDTDHKFYENFKTLQPKCGHSLKTDGLMLMNKPEQRGKKKIHRRLQGPKKTLGSVTVQ